jgi:hypothetical protein
MKWTSTDRWAAIALAAVLLTAWKAWQDPPHTIEPAPVQPVQPGEPKPTELVFGETYEDARVKRPKRIGTIETWGDDDRAYSWRYLGVGIRPATWPEGGPPTDEEFDAWLELVDNHEYAGDLDGFLAWIRND